jgi:tetratricopeptide (TPR) repeat protein
MPELLNPYIAGAPVTEASMFFGRQDVFDWIEGSLAGKYVDHILVIHGQRRVGKTSVLKQIPHHLSPRYIQVYLDLQGRAASSFDRFLWGMSREILRSLRGLTGVTVSAPEQSAFSQDPDYFHTQFLPAIASLLQDRILLLTFDEFDILSQPETMQTLGKPLTAYLNRLFELENLNFIFSIGSSGKKLENMQATYTEFFKAALYKKISFLEQAECYRLITQPVMGMLSYDPGAVQRIYRITSGQPYYTQLICHELFSACQKENKRRITSADVEAILPDVIERGTVNLKFMWDEATDLEKWVLACLAQVDGITEFRTLATELDRQHVRFSEANLNSALLHLQEKDVLHPDLSFVIHLLRSWLQANRPLGRVREELVEINPIADRFIEIGDEYRDRSAPQDAVKSYQQAISIDPSNLRAQVSIAAVFLAQSDYAQAAEAYDRALEIDPEDVQARSGICEAHLELGEAALSQGDSGSAIDHLRRVVAVNPDHTEVRQRLADILCRQAEELLARGENEPALKAFLAAQQALPEDEALRQRYDQVGAMVKGQVLSGLLERASNEWKRQNWGQAIACLEEYLEFEPEAPDVRTRLEDLRRQERLNRLSSLKTRAQEMEKAERWDDAILAWQEYIALVPEDCSQAEAALQSAQRSRELAATYAEAQAALRQKDYRHAIQLLQGIITQEPSYKDTARLLTEAVVKERAHRPVWKQRWVWAALVFIILFALTAFFGRNAIQYISSRSATPGFPLIAADPEGTLPSTAQVTPADIQQAMPSVQETQPIAALPTVTQAAGSTPTPEPAWIASFGQPALNYISSHEPDFSDDFSEAKSGWQLTSWSEAQGEKTLRYADYVAGGVLRLDKEPGTNLSLRSSNLNAPDYALTFELTHELGGDAGPGISFRQSENGSYSLSMHPIGRNANWSLSSSASEQNLIESYSPAIGYQKPFGVLLIVKGDQIAVYFGGQVALYFNDPPVGYLPAGYFQDSDFTDGNISLDFAGGMGSGGGVSNRYAIDNLKFWKLPGDLVFTSAPTQAESSIQPPMDDNDLPLWVQTFAQPLLDSIRDRPPDFEDDFSQVKPEWILSDAPGSSQIISIEKYVKDGVFRFDNAKKTPHEVLYTSKILAHDYVIQFDLSAENYLSSPTQDRFSFNKKNIAFTIAPIINECWVEGVGSISFKKRPCTSSSWKDRNQIIFMSSGERVGIYLNGEPLGYVDDIPDAGLSNYFRLGGWHNQATFILDNIKFWNLDSP